MLQIPQNKQFEDIKISNEPYIEDLNLCTQKDTIQSPVNEKQNLITPRQPFKQQQSTLILHKSRSSYNIVATQVDNLITDNFNNQNQININSNQLFSNSEDIKKSIHHKSILGNQQQLPLGAYKGRSKRILPTQNEFKDPRILQIQEQNTLLNILQEKMLRAKQLGKKYRLKNALVGALKKTESRRKAMLNNDHYNTLNDLSICIEEQEQNKGMYHFVQSCEQFIEYYIGKFIQYFKEPWHPFNKIPFIFQVIECISIIIFVFYYSLFIIFNFYDILLMNITNSILLLIFFLSTIVKINTGFFEQGKVVYDKQKLVHKYRQQTMVYDIAGYLSLIYLLIVQNNSVYTKLICVSGFFKIVIYKYNFIKIEDKINLTGDTVYRWTLLKLLGSSLALTHVVACLYYLLAVFEINVLKEEQNWVSIQGYESASPLILYNESYYWAISTITLIGSKGQTQVETLFCTIILICTVGVFASILSSVSMIWEAKEQKQKDYKRDKDIMNSFFSINNLSTDTQGQLHSYLKYTYEGHKVKTANVDFDNLIQRFPQTLQDHVQFERYSKILKSFCLFSDNFSQDTLHSLTYQMQEQYFMPNQIILKQDQFVEPKLFLILNGQVEIYQDTKQKYNKVTTLQEGEYFGFEQFFTNSAPQFSIKSSKNSFTSILGITRSQFKQIVRLKTEDNEIFNMVQDELLYKGFSNTIKHKCYICQEFTHLEKACNYLNYTVCRYFKIKKLNYSPFQERNESKNQITSKRNKQKSIKQIYLIKLKQRQILQAENRDIARHISIIQDYQKIQNMFQQEQTSSEEEENEDLNDIKSIEDLSSSTDSEDSNISKSSNLKIKKNSLQNQNNNKLFKPVEKEKIKSDLKKLSFFQKNKIKEQNQFNQKASIQLDSQKTVLENIQEDHKLELSDDQSSSFKKSKNTLSQNSDNSFQNEDGQKCNDTSNQQLNDNDEFTLLDLSFEQKKDTQQDIQENIQDFKFNQQKTLKQDKLEPKIIKEKNQKQNLHKNKRQWTNLIKTGKFNLSQEKQQQQQSSEKLLNSQDKNVNFVNIIKTNSQNKPKKIKDILNKNKNQQNIRQEKPKGFLQTFIQIDKQQQQQMHKSISVASHSNSFLNNLLLSRNLQQSQTRDSKFNLNPMANRQNREQNQQQKQQDLISTAVDMLAQNDSSLEIESDIFLNLDKIYNFRFYFIYNNAEFTIPEYNRISKRNQQKKNLKKNEFFKKKTKKSTLTKTQATDKFKFFHSPSK